MADTGKVELQPKGYSLTSEAYVVPLKDGRDTVELMETQAAELGVLRRYITSQDASLAAMSADIAALEAAQASERTAWQNSVNQLQKSVKKYKSPWSAGIFAGYDALHSEACVGVGLIYSFWRF